MKIIWLVVVIDGAVHTEEISIAWLAAMVVCALIVIFLFLPAVVEVIILVSGAVVIVVTSVIASGGLISVVVVVCIRPIRVPCVVAAFTPSVISIWMNGAMICRLWASSLDAIPFVALVQTIIVVVVSFLVWLVIASRVASAVAGLNGVLLVVVVALTGVLVAII